MPAVNKHSFEAKHDWTKAAVVGGGVGAIVVLAILALVTRRRLARRSYPQLLLSKHSIAVKNALAKGPNPVRQYTSALQSPLSSTDSSPSPNTPFASLLEERTRRLSPSELPLERGKIDVTLSYDSLALSLQVGVIGCRDLCELSLSPSGQCLLDPYVKLHLLPDSEYKVKTRTVRSTNSPQFDEHFTFYGMSSDLLSGSSLHIQVCAFDRYSRDAIVGEALLPLSQADLVVNGNISMTLSLGPETLHANKGEILLSLTYQPALNNLTLVIVKARGLSGVPDPYCKLSLRGTDGRRLMKKRTHVKRASRNPVFNESFVFELPEGQLKEAVIDVQMMQSKGNHSECMGRVLLNGADTHVSHVISWTDRQIAQWHPLE